MKSAILRPKARADLRGEILYYRKHAGKPIANQLVGAADDALQHLQENPGTGSPRIGQILDIAGLRSWHITGFPPLMTTQSALSMASQPSSTSPNGPNTSMARACCKISPMNTFIHVGCGPNRKQQTTRGFNTPEWSEVRFDIDPSAQPDVLGTMTDMAAVATGSMNALFSSHNIEHLYPHEVPVALQEFVRVLSDDGFVVLTCPDLQSVCALVAEGKLTEAVYSSPAGPIAPIDILYGHRPAMAKGNLYMAHRCGFTEKVLIGTLQAAGFTAVISRRRPAPFFDLWAIAKKGPADEAGMRALAAAHFPG